MLDPPAFKASDPTTQAAVGVDAQKAMNGPDEPIPNAFMKALDGVDANAVIVDLNEIAPASATSMLFALFALFLSVKFVPPGTIPAFAVWNTRNPPLEMSTFPDD